MIIFKWWVVCLVFTVTPPIWLYVKYKQKILDEMNIDEYLTTVCLFWAFALGIAVGKMVQ